MVDKGKSGIQVDSSIFGIIEAGVSSVRIRTIPRLFYGPVMGGGFKQVSGSVIKHQAPAPQSYYTP